MTQEHQWKKLPSGEIDEWVMEIPDTGTEHHGPGCEVCGMTFCMHCAGEKKMDCWGRPCPGTPPAGKEYDWSSLDHQFIPTLYPLIVVKKGYEMVGRKARLVENLNIGKGEDSPL